jgi:septum site-determining protein MinD
VVIDFDVGPAQPRPHHGRRTARGVRHRQRDPGRGPAEPGADQDKRVDTLSILPASQTRDKDALTKEGVGKIIEELSKDHDYILCDSPAGIEKGALLALYFADQAIVVTNPRSPRSATATASSACCSRSRSGRRKRGPGEGAPARHPLRPEPGREGRDAEARRHPRDPGDPAARRDPESESVLRASNTGTPVVMDAESIAGQAYKDAVRPLPRREDRAPLPRSAEEGPVLAAVRREGRLMSWLADLFRARKPEAPATASQAKERLQIVLAHERIGRTREDFLPKLQQEIVMVVAKYVAIDPGKVNVSLDRGGDMSTLAIEIDLPGPQNERARHAAAS